jgi:hypothetical protein
MEEECLDNMLFQEEEAVPHFHKVFMDFLNHKFPGKWTGSNSPII